MTIEVNYIDNGNGVIIRQHDVVTGKEIINAHDEIYEQHKLCCQQYHIIDKSWCTEYNVTASEMKIISALDCKMAKHNSHIIMAVVESDYLHFSLTEVWQAYIEGVIKYSQSFTNQVDALRWIEEALQMIQYQPMTNNRDRECINGNSFMTRS